ncbi:phage baseplate upper protein [Desulfobacterota bacterium AH_259_B03_O07]|nr:phage baseplate upper protein [Desulfobacterota bacterium AH_259_B03_O07]
MKLRVEVEKEIRIKKGSTEPSIQFRLFNMDNFLPVDLTGTQIKFFMEGPKDSTDKKKFQGEGEIVVNPLTGIGKYDWNPGDTDTSGTYRAEFQITFNDGVKIKVPLGEEYIKIVVENH